jgi:oligopeptidase A
MNRPACWALPPCRRCACPPAWPKVPAQVESFLRDLAERARPMAARTADELNAFAAAGAHPHRWRPGTSPILGVKAARRESSASTRKSSSPGSSSRACSTAFHHAGELFGLGFKADETIETWHEDVHFLPRARCRRPGGGRTVPRSLRPRAQVRRRLDGRVPLAPEPWVKREQQPVAYLTCNFAPPGRWPAQPADP